MQCVCVCVRAHAKLVDVCVCVRVRACACACARAFITPPNVYNMINYVRAHVCVCVLMCIVHVWTTCQIPHAPLLKLR